MKTFSAKKKLTASMFTLGLVAAGLSVAAPAQAAQLPMTPATCNVLHREVKQGKTSFSNMDRILYGSKQTVYNTMELYSQSAYNDAIKKGAQMWEQATGGKLKFKMVSAPTPRSVTIVDEHWREGSALGYGGRDSKRIRLMIDRTPAASQPMVVAHEIGHVIGLEHTCRGDLMGAGSVMGTKITDTDVALAYAAIKAQGGDK